MCHPNGGSKYCGVNVEVVQFVPVTWRGSQYVYCASLQSLHMDVQKQ
jgi:hypothetical protein